jgi:lysyl-tRNA synthetase class 2
MTMDLPGPKIPGALPLDNIAGKGTVPLAAFVLVWAMAAGFLGLVARRERLERLVAALVLAGGVGSWQFATLTLVTFFATGVSLHEALHTAATSRVVYLPAALAGVAGGVLGHRRSESRTWVPLAAAISVAIGGIIDILSVVTPGITEWLFRLDRFVPSAAPRAASIAVAAAGVVLLLVARGLARRKRRAWQIAVCMLAASSMLHLLKGLEYEEAAVTGVLALVLIARRHDFDVLGDFSARVAVLLRAVAILGVIYAYGSVALFIGAAHADRPFLLTFVLRETTSALFGGGFRTAREVHGWLEPWFPRSVTSLEMVGIGVAVVSWLAPWRYRPREGAPTRQAVRALVREWGTDTLSPFALRSDKSSFLSRDGRALIAYTVVAGVALVGGDPIGPSDAVEEAVRRFLREAHEKGWRVAFLGASDRSLAVAGRCGLRSMYWGDEAVVDPDAFSLEGRQIRKVRQSVHRLERAGYVVDIRPAAELTTEERAQLLEIARVWRGDRAVHGFAMALDRPFELDGDDELFVIGRNADGTPQGFLHFVRAWAGSALSLSSMPRLPSTPNGFNEWLTCAVLGWARDRGFAKVSLNFAAFRSLFDPDAELSRLRRLQRNALLIVRSRMRLQLDSLLRFTKKFQPDWQQRYVIYERRSDLPRIGLAALTAEGYLPGSDRRPA